MKAVVYHSYGSPDVLRLEEIEKPVVREDAVLVRIRAAAANPYDWHLMRGEPYLVRLFSGLRAPKATCFGVDFAGQVEAVGEDVTEFHPGDEVFGMCKGAFAEYLSAPETDLALKPAQLSFEQAAAVPLAALTALQGLRDRGKLQIQGALPPGQRVLIIGASGGVGTFAVQIAKVLGAVVTGVCSMRNLELVRSLGADHVIDYTREGYTQGDEKYDLIFQLAGTHSPSQCRRALAPRGVLVLCSGDSDGRWIGGMDRVLKAAAWSPFVSQRLVGMLTKRSKKDLQYIAELVEAGKVRPVIDRTYSLAEAPEAIRYLEKGHARGKVVITV